MQLPRLLLGLRGDPHKGAEGWERALGAFRDVAESASSTTCSRIAEKDGANLYNSAFLSAGMGQSSVAPGRRPVALRWEVVLSGRRVQGARDGYREGRMIVCADGRLPEISRNPCAHGR